MALPTHAASFMGQQHADFPGRPRRKCSQDNPLQQVASRASLACLVALHISSILLAMSVMDATDILFLVAAALGLAIAALGTIYERRDTRQGKRRNRRRYSAASGSIASSRPQPE
jgi:hypothetical protein